MNDQDRTSANNHTQPEHKVYLSIGSNIDPEINFQKGVSLLEEACKIEAISEVWETPPAHASGPNFLNAACCILTNLSPLELKNNVLRPLETRMGRVRTADKNAPRPIDLDIIVFDQNITEPRVWTEVFLAVPLAQLLPELRHPVTKDSLAQVALSLIEITPVKPRPDVSISFSRAL